jgi:hypothetical protein
VTCTTSPDSGDDDGDDDDDDDACREVVMVVLWCKSLWCTYGVGVVKALAGWMANANRIRYKYIAVILLLVDFRFDRF